jgi:putative acetyltransferase
VHANESLRAAVAYAGRRPSYENPIAFDAGTPLTIERSDDEWPDFHWGVTPAGGAGWVLRSAFALADGATIDALPARAVAVADYDARELALVPGERLLVGDDLGGWRWGYSSTGDAGWVRKADLAQLEDAPRFTMRRLRPGDDAAVADIIRSVMPEFGADGPGFAIHDAEVGAMHAAYDRAGAAYFVIEKDGQVLGGGGIAPLDGETGVCELRKMYFKPGLRGLGAGTALIGRCLHAARRLGYARCYLETLTGMDAAQQLYERAGFARIAQAMGATGHFGCNRFYLRAL